MKKLLLLLPLLAIMFAGCSEGERTENLDIKLQTGEAYRFRDNIMSVEMEPYDFIAEFDDNEIIGMHHGKTQMTVTGGNTTYYCNIDVIARTTYYADMTMYLGSTRESIEALYQQPLSKEGNVYFYGKLMGLDILPEIGNAFIYENNKVVSCAIYFDQRNGVHVANHLKERYEVYDTKNYVSLFGDDYEYDYCNILVVYDFSQDPVYVAYSTKRYAELDRGRSSASFTDNFKFQRK